MNPETEKTPAWRRWLEAIGIRLAPHTRWHQVFQPRFLVFLGACALGGLVFLAGAVKYSTSPTFCNSCHIMAPYYSAWKNSKHSHVACVDCHYPPSAPRTLLWKKFQALSQVVKYVTRTYSSKPFAEVEDTSCLRSGCHSQRLLEGKVVTKAGIRFDHRPHVTQARRGRQLRCVSCHSQVVVGKHIEVTYDTCYLCHFKGRGEGRSLQPLGGCLGCHTLPARDIRIGNMTYRHKDFVTKQGVPCGNCHLEVVRGKGEAPQERCLICHNQPEKLARYGDIPFIHENHVTKHNIACFHCHQEMSHGAAEAPEKVPPIAGGAQPSAAAPAAPPAPAAHSAMPTLTFDCSYCHQGKHSGQLEMYSGKASPLGLPDMPSPMFLANVDCVGCHYAETGGKAAEFTGKTEKASEQACVKCHGARFKGILQETRDELRKTLEQLAAKSAAVRAGLAKSALKDGERKALSSAAAHADRLVSFVLAGHGDHNIYLASEALRRADKALSEAGAKAGAEAADLSSFPLISGSYCATLCHQKVGVKVPPDTVRAFGKAMPHKNHADMLGCVNCHDIGGHKKVPLRKGVKSKCAECHP
ncbi:MAG: NapC/NirT family cytochrome c [Elusimicrobia bacterium]|nr:NapC/NirT family cytochrome c [Elusimicrobiota bacterium]